MADHLHADDKAVAKDIQVEKAIEHVDDSHNLDAAAKAAEYKMAAIEAENAEHDMGVLEAVKAYPMAATWAFVMSCTIVRTTLSACTHRNSRLTCLVDYGSVLRFHHGQFRRLTGFRQRLRCIQRGQEEVHYRG